MVYLDNWALKAKQMGYRSRAVFKLEEIFNKTRTNSYKYVLDLGSSPGAWSQFILKKNSNANVFALDILDMEPIEGVKFFKQDIEQIYNIPQIFKLKGNFNLVISDIAPNLSGIKLIDNKNIFDLNKLTIDIASDFLCRDGTLIMKTFQNNFLKTLRKDMELSFKIVQTYKPAASKKKSGEIYLYGEK